MRVGDGREQVLSSKIENEKSTEKHSNKGHSRKHDNQPKVTVIGLVRRAGPGWVFHLALDVQAASIVGGGA